MQFPFLLIAREARRERTCSNSLGASWESPASPLAEDAGSGTKSLVMCTFLHPRIPSKVTRPLVETSGPPFAACYEEYQLRPSSEHRIRTPRWQKGGMEPVRQLGFP